MVIVVTAADGELLKREAERIVNRLVDSSLHQMELRLALSILIRGGTSRNQPLASPDSA